MLNVTTWAIVRGHEIFRDDIEADVFWVLPAGLDVSTTDDGAPELQLVLHRSLSRGGGGMLTATLLLHTSDDERALIAADLRRVRGRASEVRAAPLVNVRVTMDAGGDAPVELAKGPTSPQGRLAVSASLDQGLATMMKQAIEGGEGLSLRATFEVEGRRGSMDATITIDEGRVHAGLTSGEDSMLAALDLQDAMQRLLEDGSVRVETGGAVEAALDASLMIVTETRLEPVDVATWRVGMAPEAPATVQYALADARAQSLRRAVTGDLGRLAARHGGVEVRAIDLDRGSDFFAMRELGISVLGDFAAHQIHAVIVEVRGGDTNEAAMFNAPGDKSLRFRGSPTLEVRARVMVKHGQAIGYHRSEIATPWQAVTTNVWAVQVDAIAPLWTLDLDGSQVDWSRHPRVEARVRYVDEANEIDDEAPMLLTADAPRPRVTIRPYDGRVRAVAVTLRFAMADGSVRESTQTVNAPGVVMVTAPS